jgi:ATP-binding cassette, subfamily B, bacterial CvaB/MchF/RaxB
MKHYRLDIGASRSLPVILQTEEAECGLACIGMVAIYHGHRFLLSDLRMRFAVSRKGASLASLIEIARALRLNSRPLRLEPSHLSQLQLPCVLHWDMNHFVVLKSVGPRKLAIHDPAVGARRLTPEEFSRHFTGVALELTPSHEFVPEGTGKSVQLKRLLGHVVGLRRGVLHVLALALVLEVIAIAMPMYLQWIVDHALAAADRDLITTLGIGFCLLVVLQTAVSALRGSLVSSLSASFDFQWLGNVFGHLLRLPLDYFEKRHTGAIMSYFGSVTSIQQALTVAFVQGVVDGVLVVGTFAVMLSYNVGLCAIACAAVLAYAVLRAWTFGGLRDATAEEILQHARQSTHFLETLRGMQGVRLFGRQQERQISWMNLLADELNAQLRGKRLLVIQQAAGVFLLGIERVVVIWLAALLAIRQELTTGMLLAFIAYKEQFSTRIAGLIDKLFELRMLGLHAERVADVVYTHPEPSLDTAPLELSHVEPSLELRDVHYAYSQYEDPVLNGISLRIAPGELVAITGRSGCGKTTLAKIMLGLLEPSGGELRVGGHKVKALGLENYRTLLGAVMQDDCLFTGTIAQNISFFDPEPDNDHVEACARRAAIHDEILAMPMGYSSLVGDLGSGLSGGQKQRILLARALYKRPKILLLDEATSHLDVTNEQWVNAAIGAMNLTRIVIAHRPETIAMAERVIVISKGKIEHDSGRAPPPNTSRRSGAPALEARPGPGAP